MIQPDTIRSICLVVLTLLPTVRSSGQDSLPPLQESEVPRTVAQLWADYDPRAEPLDVELVREWTEQGITYRHVRYTVGTFLGKPSKMAAFYGFPTDASGRLPAVMHLHGGGQRAFLNAVKQYAQRGYACLSINWGGREMEQAQADAPNTDWGAVDPTQNNVAGYSSLLPKPNTIDRFESPRNNNWYLLTIGARRGLTFLEQQPEVDPQRIGVWGHSMGGRLTCLVAGSDHRIKVAAPSVGGSGFLQDDLWGIRGSARRVSGDPQLFKQTLAGQSYLARVECPILFLSSTNDFNAPMDWVERGMALVPHDDQRTVYAVHLNHRFTPETDVARKLWIDAYLLGRVDIPQTPHAELLLGQDRGVPVFQVTPDTKLPVERVDIYYGYGRDPRNRFWADGQAILRDGVWSAECPVFDLEEPLFVMANVRYSLTADQRQADDPAGFVLSVARTAYPDELRQAGVKATAKASRQIDDFSRGLHDWYVLNAGNRHHWRFATRKLADPRWDGPREGKLRFEIDSDGSDNVIAVQIETDAWRNYLSRAKQTYTAVVPLADAGRHSVSLEASDFVTADGQPLSDWDGITELVFLAGDKARPDDSSLNAWRGSVPSLVDLRWEGGEVITRPKPYPQ